jgi:sugar diacid utilization regulator
MRNTVDPARVDLSNNLRSRRREIEGTVLARLFALSNATPDLGSRLAADVSDSVEAAIAYGLTTVEDGEHNTEPIPATLLARARIASRIGIGLDTVIRHYVAGYSVFVDNIISAAHEHGHAQEITLRRVLRDQAILFERLVAKISEEHAREAEVRLETSEQRRAARLKRHLEGELVDVEEFAYDFDATHLALIAVGPRSADAVRKLVAAPDDRLLVVRQDRKTTWAWLGDKHKISSDKLARQAAAALPKGVMLAIGETGQRLEGWRLSHRQARAALAVAKRRAHPIIRYADVMLLAMMLRDDLFASSLRERYLVPLDAQRDGGRIARDTLRAYLSADQNTSSAAAALGVNRRTVTNRLRLYEAEFGRSIDRAAAEIDAALQFRELSERSDPI